jgi:hypothetical protein
MRSIEKRLFEYEKEALRLKMLIGLVAEGQLRKWKKNLKNLTDKKVFSI